ncbi:ubiquitin-specific protease ubp15 [Marasmius sp. AFHP31]|nr:ubiquitin-specific protease ubp15 [Marasmius sp. AFHP31]
MDQEDHHKPFFSRYLQAPPTEVIDSTTYSWLIDDTKPLWANEPISSPEFSCGEQTWKIMFAMFGESTQRPDLFAEPRPEALKDITVVSLSRSSSSPEFATNNDTCVQFAIMIASDMDPSLWFCDQKICRFSETNNWGVAHAGVLRTLDVTGKQNNPNHELRLRITVHIRVLGELKVIEKNA